MPDRPPRPPEPAPAGTAPRVAVVTPLYQLPLAPEERISLAHLRRFLGDRDRWLAVPASLALPAELTADFQVRRFPNRFFRGVQGYNRLMLSPALYEAFAAYDYLLLYQLDCLVFSSDLESWCARGWDYLGAPWFPGWSSDPAQGFWAVGNGGLSLRRIAAFREVLQSRRNAVEPRLAAAQTERFRSLPLLQGPHRLVKRVAYELGYRTSLKSFLRHYPAHEDVFWSLDAVRFAPGFRVAPVAEALGFAFEQAPGFCFQANGGRLPFGCHGWYKFDRAFWEPHLVAAA